MRFEYCMVQQNFTLKEDHKGRIYESVQGGVSVYDGNSRIGPDTETFLEMFNFLGGDGWEMCGSNPQSHPIIYYFKRIIE